MMVLRGSFCYIRAISSASTFCLMTLTCGSVLRHCDVVHCRAARGCDVIEVCDADSQTGGRRVGARRCGVLNLQSHTRRRKEVSEVWVVSRDGE